MKISKEEVIYIAKLAKLRFSDEEAEKMTGEFESILGHFQSIDRMDLENVDPDEFADRKESIVRADENVVFGDNEKLFSNGVHARNIHTGSQDIGIAGGVRMSGGFKDAKDGSDPAGTMSNGHMGIREISAGVAGGKWSAYEITEMYIDKIKSMDDRIGAFLTICEESARAQAKAVDEKIRSGKQPGKLAGVPVAVKDNICTDGIRTLCFKCLRTLSRHIMLRSLKLINEDAVIVGKQTWMSSQWDRPLKIQHSG